MLAYLYLPAVTGAKYESVANLYILASEIHVRTINEGSRTNLQNQSSLALINVLFASSISQIEAGLGFLRTDVDTKQNVVVHNLYFGDIAYILDDLGIDRIVN